MGIIPLMKSLLGLSRSSNHLANDIGHPVIASAHSLQPSPRLAGAVNVEDICLLCRATTHQCFQAWAHQGSQFPLLRGPKSGAQGKVPLDLSHLFLSLIWLRRGYDGLTTIICPQRFALTLNFHSNVWLLEQKPFLHGGGQWLLTAVPSKGSWI